MQSCSQIANPKEADLVWKRVVDLLRDALGWGFEEIHAPVKLKPFEFGSFDETSTSVMDVARRVELSDQLLLSIESRHQVTP